MSVMASCSSTDIKFHIYHITLNSQVKSDVCVWRPHSLHTLPGGHIDRAVHYAHLSHSFAKKGLQVYGNDQSSQKSPIIRAAAILCMAGLDTTACLPACRHIKAGRVWKFHHLLIDISVRRYSVGNLHFFFHTQRKKLPNLGSNSWFSLPGSYCLMVRWYEPGRENHEFDPRLGNFLLCVLTFQSLCGGDHTILITDVRHEYKYFANLVEVCY